MMIGRVKQGIVLFISLFVLPAVLQANPPIYIAFLWHMHQPIYWPGETVTQTENAGHYGYDVKSIFTDRTGPYTTYATDAIEAGMNGGLGHLGASVSFTGSLMDNLDDLEAHAGVFSGWTTRWIQGRGYNTTQGNPRLDMIGFGFYHPLNGLIEYSDIRKQIQAHRANVYKHFGSSVPYSKGYFPAETAFSPRMIPALADESIQWVIVDNVHFDRACAGYPWNSGGNLYEPNPSDQRNPNPNDWVQLNGVWAPTQISGGFGHRPHYTQYTDPSTGQTKKIIVVPGDRYMGNEDARGGYGALQYDSVMSQLASYNTDANHPLLIVLHHDGDNYGGGTDSYYRSNFSNFVAWLQANPSRFVCTTIQDYIDLFPPDTTDIIHVEDGSWSGADNGDPEFLKWNGNPDNTGYSPDRNSWGVMVAAKNRVDTANQISPSNSNSTAAYANFLVGEASDYWYWEPNASTWDGHPTRAANLATPYADAVIGGGSADSTGPTIYVPQREPYNPGGTEWSIAQSTSFQVWTYVYDVSGLGSVNLKYRSDNDGTITKENDLYSTGTSVGSWISVAMSSSYQTPQTTVTPNYKSWQYYANVPGVLNTEYDYYVEATDSKGFVSKSQIRHVKVGPTGAGGGGGGGSGTVAWWTPSNPSTGQTLSIYYDPVSGTLPDATSPVYIHLGNNYWAQVTAPNPAMSYDSSTNYWRYDYVIPSIASTVDFVFTNITGTVGGNWDNNGGKDWHVSVGGATTGGGGGGGGSNHTTAVWWSPVTPSAGSTINVYYDPVPGGLPDVTNPVFIHYGYNRWATVLSDTAMTYDASTQYWKYTITIPISAKTVDFVFNNGSGTWDNNANADWHIATLGASSSVDYVLDGSLDTSASLIATSVDSSIHLLAAWNGSKLYVATEKAGNSLDKFIVITKTLSSLTGAFWAKTGQVAQWDAFIGNEVSNNYQAWFNAQGSAAGWAYAVSTAGSGTYLEGTIDLQSLYGSIPSTIYIAAVSYGSADGGSITSQAPAGNGNGNLESNEFQTFVLTPVSVNSWTHYSDNLDYYLRK